MKYRFLSVLVIVLALATMVSCSTSSGKPEESIPIFPAISSYNVVMHNNYDPFVRPAILQICTLNSEVDGETIHPKLVSDITSETEYEILVGSSTRADSRNQQFDLGPMDYTIRILKNKKIIIQGGSRSSTAAGAARFAELVKDGTITTLDEFEYTFRFFENHEIDPLSDINSPESQAIISGWLEQFESPAWGGLDRDIKESLYALSHKYSAGTGRFAVFAHRGDMSHYPENSLPGVIAAIMSGADSVEVDYRYTKDFVPVLMHDGNLNRTTDWADKAGKNGLPTSMVISDWTYDELRQLNLLDYYGNVTEYKIPLLYDVLKLANGRIQVAFDDKSSSGLGVEDEFIPLATGSGSCSSLIMVVCQKLKSTKALEGLVSKELLDFAESCMKSGSFIGSYGFYNDSTLMAKANGDYLSLAEDSYYWDYLLMLGKRYLGTNQCYKISQYMRDKGMKAWTY